MQDEKKLAFALMLKLINDSQNIIHMLATTIDSAIELELTPEQKKVLTNAYININSVEAGMRVIKNICGAEIRNLLEDDKND